MYIPNGLICLECGDDFQESNHIRSVSKCAKCKYQSACSRAILEHISSCNGESNIDTMTACPLGSEMFCICGYSSSEGENTFRTFSTMLLFYFTRIKLSFLIFSLFDEFELNRK